MINFDRVSQCHVCHGYYEEVKIMPDGKKYCITCRDSFRDKSKDVDINDYDVEELKDRVRQSVAQTRREAAVFDEDEMFDEEMYDALCEIDLNKMPKCEYWIENFDAIIRKRERIKTHRNSYLLCDNHKYTVNISYTNIGKKVICGIYKSYIIALKARDIYLETGVNVKFSDWYNQYANPRIFAKHDEDNTIDEIDISAYPVCSIWKSCSWDRKIANVKLDEDKYTQCKDANHTVTFINKRNRIYCGSYTTIELARKVRDIYLHHGVNMRHTDWYEDA